MEIVAEILIVRKGRDGLVIKAEKKKAKAMLFRIFDRLRGQCFGVCLTKAIMKVSTPGGEPELDHVECDKVNCNCHCVRYERDLGDGWEEWGCECKR